MHLRNWVVAALAAAGTSHALGQGDPPETELRYEVRRFDATHNNGWGSTLDALPGDRIEVRAMVSYIGTAPVIALGQIIFQPTLSNWATGDALLTNSLLGQSGGLFHPDGIGSSGSYITTPPAGVPDVPGAYGRAMPFTAAAVGSRFYRGHTQSVAGISYLRIARSDVTNWFGVGPSSGAGAVNNTNGGGGVLCWQGSLGFGRPSSAPPPLIATQDILVFKFGFTLSTSPASRELSIFTPPLGIGRFTGSSGYGGPATGWFVAPDEGGPGSHRTDVEVVAGLLRVVPSPATLGLFAFACVYRRRNRA